MIREKKLATPRKRKHEMSRHSVLTIAPVSIIPFFIVCCSSSGTDRLSDANDIGKRNDAGAYRELIVAAQQDCDE